MVSFSRSVWKKLHRAEKIYTGSARGARDNYEVWIHKGKSHKGSELPHCEKIRDPGIDLSLNVTPVKDIREEGTNLQVFECDACEKKFESEDTLDNHMEIHGECVRCASCTQFFYDCDEAIACPGYSHPWPFWRSRPRL